VSDEKPNDTARDTAGQEPTGPGTDVGQIDAAELDERAFPASLASEYRVVIADEAFEAIKTHAQSDTSIELCGVLAGTVCKDDDGPFLMVERAIAGVATRRTGSQVTFTHETWGRIHQQMEEECPDLRIVGWYHTHPGFGIFLSEMDQFIQDNFFNLPHQVAFVYDPVSERRGLFVWKGGKSSRLRRYWLGGELVYDEADGPEAEPPMRREAPREEPEDDFDRRPPPRTYVAPEPEQPLFSWSILWLAGALVAVYLAFWLGGQLTGSAALQSGKQAKDFEALIRTGLFRDGLDRDLDRVLSRLNDAHNQLQVLQDTLAKEAADGKPPKAVTDGLEGILAAHRELGTIRENYTRIDRLARNLDRVADMPNEIALLEASLDAVRVRMAELYIVQAKMLTVEDSPELRRQLAAEFAGRAVKLEPKLRELIEKDLPGLLPSEKTKAPPTKSEKGAKQP